MISSLTLAHVDVRNPISLAKLILDTSSQPLSLRRVPPNALVGEGARCFAEEHGMITFANEYLVSKNSRDRFFRWQEDLLRAEERTQDTRTGLPSTPLACVPCQFDTGASKEVSKSFPRDHTAAIMAGIWNEGQPDSPYAGTPAPESASMQESSLFPTTSRIPPPSFATIAKSLQRSGSRSPFAKNAAAEPRLESPPVSRPLNIGNTSNSAPTLTTAPTLANAKASQHATSPFRDGSTSPQDYNAMHADRRRANDEQNFSSANPNRLKRPLQDLSCDEELNAPKAKRYIQLDSRDEDTITDTIGAIAIDDQGRIAAGSSSGGIGMKHRGRLGPAALVGIGTAVVPCAEDDDEGTTVACVTSGTGEHMATTMASQRCAERVYHGTRRGGGGRDVQDDDDDSVMESFIANDFMNHPGVKNCHSQGAIGIMVVKKCRTGYYLYFAHNTDSFALASMGGLEKEPRCTMSRLPEAAKIAKGGRKIRVS